MYLSYVRTLAKSGILLMTIVEKNDGSEMAGTDFVWRQPFPRQNGDDDYR